MSRARANDFGRTAHAKTPPSLSIEQAPGTSQGIVLTTALNIAPNAGAMLGGQ
jgi:hypothetical protein